MASSPAVSTDVLVDASILVYAHLRQDAAKQRRAITALEVLAESGRGYLSVQTLGEFFATVTSARKFDTPMSRADAREVIRDFLETWPILDVTAQIALEAARGVTDHAMSYWD